MKNLYAAMVKAQKEMENPSFDSQNPHFKSRYASLVAVCAAVIPVLNKHGLAVEQWPVCRKDGELLMAGCKTILMHESGESQDSECLLPLDKMNAHGAGSCITYARRYSLMAIAGVVGDEDDDGNAAVEPKSAVHKIVAAKVTPNSGAGETLSPDQKRKVAECAGSIIDWFTNGSPDDAYVVYDNRNMDAEETLYLWSFLDSDMRSSIKKTASAKGKKPVTA